MAVIVCGYNGSLPQGHVFGGYKSWAPRIYEYDTAHTFRIQWLSTERLPFRKTCQATNPWTEGREIENSRFGTALHPSVGNHTSGPGNVSIRRVNYSQRPRKSPVVDVVLAAVPLIVAFNPLGSFDKTFFRFIFCYIQVETRHSSSTRHSRPLSIISLLIILFDLYKF
ncbi:hypothetical protein DL96DRAFT_1288761 [Flagelloscypha sp. PMI_526]|nr:hypothetical protein DL96DRAFT_1288761 [Flagelloscypha sp. PMI_526]